MPDKTNQDESNVVPLRKPDDPGRSYIEKYAPMIRDGYRADFSRDTRVHPPVYHFIISRDGSRDILVFSQASSLEIARQQAEEEITAMQENNGSEAAEAGS